MTLRVFQSLSVVTTMVPTFLRHLRRSLQIKKIITNAPCVLQFAAQPEHIINNSEKDWLLGHLPRIKKTAEIAKFLRTSFLKQLRLLENIFGSSFYQRVFLCQFVDRKVVGLMLKYCLLAGNTNLISFFPLYKMMKMSKQQRFILKLSLTYWGSVNHQQSVHHTLSTLPVGKWNAMVAFKTNQ